MDSIVLIGVVIVVVLLLRAFGAWMLRIDEVIKLQKDILEEIKRQNGTFQH